MWQTNRRPSQASWPWPPSSIPSPLAFRLAHAERALDFQMASIDAAQGRAAIVLGAIGLTASVLLPGAIGRVEAGRGQWLFGIGLFALLVAAAVTAFAVWPRKYDVTVMLPDALSQRQMTRSMTATINTRLLPRCGYSAQRVWWAVMAGLVTFAINALAWGALHFMEETP
jgi:hypothetical protein